jgi:hypothetical protein
LDSVVVSKLRGEAKKRGGKLPRFEGVKWLTPDVSRQYQDFARKHVRDWGLDLRVHLEILYWREA